MMKKVALLAALLLMALQGMAQNVEKLFAQYRNQPDVDYIEVPQDMLQNLVGQAIGSSTEDAESQPGDKNEDTTDWSNRLKKISCVRVLNVENAALAKKIGKQMRKFVGKGYEVMMQTEEEDERVMILQRTEKGVIHELLIVNEEADECQVVQICGQIDAKDIGKLISMGH